MLKPPCKPDCPDRIATCHSTCEKYKLYRAKMDELCEIRFNERERKKLLDDHVILARKNFRPKTKVGEI